MWHAHYLVCAVHNSGRWYWYWPWYWVVPSTVCQFPFNHSSLLADETWSQWQCWRFCGECPHKVNVSWKLYKYVNLEEASKRDLKERQPFCFPCSGSFFSFVLKSFILMTKKIDTRHRLGEKWLLTLISFYSKYS